ncbi:MAG: dTMP kinase [Leptospirillia bacterium]
MIPSLPFLSASSHLSSDAPSPAPGLLIVFEGMDGSGKSTQAKRLAGRLEGRGHPVLLTREPGGTSAGKKIREILLDPDLPLDPEAELFLFEADRVMHVKTVLLPALRSGKTVLSDRGSDATVAYQSFGAGLSREFVSALNRVALGGLVPDVTFLFDLPVAEMALRLRSRGDGPTRFELLGSDYFERVREGYLELARIHEGRTVVLDATSGPDLLEERIFGELSRRYPERFVL